MILYTDGGRNKDGAYGSWAVFLDDGTCIAFMDREPYPDIDTNNGAEYTAMLKGLEHCASRLRDEENVLIGEWPRLADDRFKHITVHSDSKLIINQVLGAWAINYEHLRILREKIVEIMKVFDTISLVRVPREIIVGKLGH